MTMKKYVLLRLENNANKVLDEKYAMNYEEAIQIFNRDSMIRLDNKGYLKIGKITYCIAEAHKS